MFTAVVRNHKLHRVYTIAGAITTVDTVTMCLSHVLPTQLKQLLWLEKEIHGLDVLKCFTVISGEPFVMMDSLMQQQELLLSWFWVC